MAYGYAQGNYNPTTQKNSQVAGSQPKSGAATSTNGSFGQTGVLGSDPRIQTSSSQNGSPVTPTGQISQAPATGSTATGGLGTAPQTMPGAYPGQQAIQSPYGAYPATYSWQGSPTMDLTQSAVMGALQNPLYGPQQVAAMKGLAKDQSATMTQQLNEASAQNAASRGTYGSGNEQANERRIGTTMAQGLMNQYNGIDLAATQANRDDLFKAIGAGQGFTGLDEGLNQNAVESALSSFFQNRGQDIQSQLGNRGIDAQLTGYKMNLAGDLIGALLGYQNSNNQLGYQYSALDAAQQNALLARLLGGA